jgi:transposase-like protein
MSKPKRTFTAEFKRDAIALSERGDRSIAQIERDLGLSAGRRSERALTLALAEM